MLRNMFFYFRCDFDEGHAAHAADATAAGLGKDSCARAPADAQR